MEEGTEKQHTKQYDWLKQYQFQKGQSGNPGGRPKGKSLKTFARELLESMDDEDKADFMKQLDPKTIWEMAEGKAKQDIDSNIKANINIIVPKQVAEAFNINGTNTETSTSNPEQI